MPTANFLAPGEFTHRVPVVTLCRMGKERPLHERPIHRIRWQNFRNLVGDHYGAITEAATRLGKSQAQVSGFGNASPFRNIGDDIAAEIEAAYGLPSGALDYPPDPLTGSALPTNGTLAGREEAVNFDPSPDMVAEAEQWVRFEEKRFGELRPVRRAERLIQLYRQIAADGGHLSPEHAEAIITSQGESTNEPKPAASSTR